MDCLLKRSAHYFWIILLLVIHASCDKPLTPETKNGQDWPVYLGDKYNSHYSPLAQITKENVGALQKVWEYSSETLKPTDNTQIQCNPLIIDGVMYGTTPKLGVFAVNAATGEEIWRFNSIMSTNLSLNVNRGVTYWQNGDDKRIFFTIGSFLYALNAITGYPVQTFGEYGKVSIKGFLPEEAKQLYVVATTPGIIYKDLLILGSRVSEGVKAAPGHIVAYDVRTGEQRWMFRTIPRPGEYGYESWPEDAYRYIGGVNSWAGFALDEARGMLFVPTGSASYDFYGGNRKGANLFANCLIALDAATGKRIWHFQTVHHDIWDRDLPSAPNLVTVNHDGQEIDAVAQITKSGFVFLFDRETGSPLFPIEERPVQQTDLDGEETWPTQPFPIKPPPFAGQKLTLENVTNISTSSHDFVKGILEKVRTGEQFIPPSKQGTIIYPGFDGGGEWGGAAIDPHKGIMYVNANEMAWILTMIDIDNSPDGETLSPGKKIFLNNCAMCHGQEMQGDPTGTYPKLVGVGDKYPRTEIVKIITHGKNMMPGWAHLGDKQIEAVIQFITDQEEDGDPHMLGMENKSASVPYMHTGYNRFFDPEGYPAMRPPWGTLNAIDLNKGEILWKVPLGEFEALTARGIPKTGTENYGGPVLTASGLLFIGASQDEYFRAFDASTGEELWKHKLPAGGYATPSIYSVNGRQYTVIACGGGKMGTKSGSSYMAFSLPD